MLYLISGVSRSGKTLVAKALLEKYRLPYLSLDYVMMGFMHGVPEMEIHDKLWPAEIAEKMWRFIEPFMETIIYSKEDYVVEGEALLPNLLDPFIKKHKDNVRVVFMGYADTTLERKSTEIKKYATKEDWLVSLGDEEINKHIVNMIGYSKLIKQEALQYGFPYIDTATDFTENIERCIAILYQDEK